MNQWVENSLSIVHCWHLTNNYLWLQWLTVVDHSRWCVLPLMQTKKKLDLSISICRSNRKRQQYHRVREPLHKRWTCRLNGWRHKFMPVRSRQPPPRPPMERQAVAQPTSQFITATRLSSTTTSPFHLTLAMRHANNDNIPTSIATIPHHTIITTRTRSLVMAKRRSCCISMTTRNSCRRWTPLVRPTSNIRSCNLPCSTSETSKLVFFSLFYFRGGWLIFKRISRLVFLWKLTGFHQ